MAEVDITEVRLGERSYRIIVGDGLLDEAGYYLKGAVKGNSAFVITSSTVRRLYYEMLLHSLKKEGFDVECFEVEDGEGGKDFRYYLAAISSLSEFDEPVERVVVVVNLGGGVVGDLGGFVAGTYRRGIPYVQIPTTVLAMADSGVGGKTGIDFTRDGLNIKNKVGVIHQPSLVLCDIAVLKTLQRRHISNGLSEVIKHGIIWSKELFDFIEGNLERIISGESSYLFRALSLSYRIKAQIVSEDERETKGLRTLLNFGHTIGHAVEAASGNYLHGEAVSIGMVCANDIAIEMGMMRSEDALRIEALLMRAGLPVRMEGLKTETVMKALKHDKKFTGRIRMVFSREIGRAEVVEGVSVELIERIVRKRGGC